MKTKLLYFLLIGSFLTSCTSTVKQNQTDDTLNGFPIKILIFDSCEYVGISNGSGYNYTHKGNCKNCKTLKR